MKKKSAMEESAEEVGLRQNQVFREFSLESRAGKTDIEEVVEGAYQQLGENDWRLAADLFKIQDGEKRKEGFIIEQTFFDDSREGFDVFTDEILGELKEIKNNFKIKGWNILRLEVQAGPDRPTKQLTAEVAKAGSERWGVRVVNWTLNEEGEGISGDSIEFTSILDIDAAFATLEFGIEQVLERYRQRLPREG